MTTVHSSSTPFRSPPISQSDAVTSLLSLSIAAAASGPISIPTPDSSSTNTSQAQHPSNPSSVPIPSASLSTSAKHHRRLGSTGKTRRRLSDAREASARPLLASTTAALSLASLSLSSSPPSTHSHTISASFGTACKPLAPKPPSTGNIHIIAGSAPNSVHVPLSDGSIFPISSVTSTSSTGPDAGENAIGADASESNAISISNGKPGKKRGVDYKCESCSKIYRHPNCLNKHRWEHTLQWREASKFVLSKHQQVQLLEAAAILSFMGQQPTSLPPDRSEWPSFLSGGSLPKVEQVQATPTSTSTSHTTTTGAVNTTTTTYPIHPISSSVPISSGPRMHDYALASAGGAITQLRPGLVGVTTAAGDRPTALGMGAYRYPLAAGYVVNPYGAGFAQPQQTTHADVPPAQGQGLAWSRSGSDGVSRSLSFSASSVSPSMRSSSGSVSKSDEEGDVDVIEGDADGMDMDEEDFTIGRRRISMSRSLPTRGGSRGYSMAYPTASPLHSTTAAPAGYGSYGTSARKNRFLMKREEDDMSVGFSVREEDEEEPFEQEQEEKAMGKPKWDGMEMDLDMDMD